MKGTIMTEKARELRTINRELRTQYPVVHASITTLTGIGAGVVLLSARQLVRTFSY